MAGQIGKFFKRAGLTVGVLLLAGIAFIAHEWYARPFFINNYFNRVFIQYIWDKPEMLTRMRLFEQIGITDHNAEWNDDSVQRHLLESSVEDQRTDADLRSGMSSGWR